MKTKRLVIIGLCFLTLCTWEAIAKNPKCQQDYYEINSIPDGLETIDLYGTLILNIGPNTIEAGANDEVVYIQFNQTFGNVNISIYNSLGGLVYSTVVNTNVQQVVIIPFSSAAIGTYTVELNNAIGYAEGDFEHN